MNKLLGLSILGFAMLLAGCGGDSDSSGNKKNIERSEEFYFGHLSSCTINNGVIVATSLPGCTVQTSKLNKGQKFSLSCSRLNQTKALYRVKALATGDLNSVERDLEERKHFQYTCAF